MTNNGRGLSGDKQGLQISSGGSTPTTASIDYKKKYIELNKSLTALKRGKPTDWDLEVLGCSIDEFGEANQYIVANEFNVKERAAFVKRLESLGVDLFDSWYFKKQLDKAREQGLVEEERVLGNLLFNGQI